VVNQYGPEYWNLEELEKVKASISIRNWNAQYMQDPVAEEGAIIKRDWWRPWKKSIPASTTCYSKL
jgi:hypothetical protein